MPRSADELAGELGALGVSGYSDSALHEAATNLQQSEHIAAALYSRLTPGEVLEDGVNVRWGGSDMTLVIVTAARLQLVLDYKGEGWFVFRGPPRVRATSIFWADVLSCSADYPMVYIRRSSGPMLQLWFTDIEIRSMDVCARAMTQALTDHKTGRLQSSTSSTSAADDLLEHLERLAALHKDGHLTYQEFTAAKARLLQT